MAGVYGLGEELQRYRFPGLVSFSEQAVGQAQAKMKGTWEECTGTVPEDNKQLATPKATLLQSAPLFAPRHHATDDSYFLK